jgi:hypothetical protein
MARLQPPMERDGQISCGTPSEIVSRVSGPGESADLNTAPANRRGGLHRPRGVCAQVTFCHPFG